MKAVKVMKPIEALNRIGDIVFGYVTSQAFLAACTLGVFDAFIRSILQEKVSNHSGA